MNRDTPNTLPATPLSVSTKGVKLAIGELAFIGWLAQAPGNRFAMLLSRSGAKLYEKMQPRPDGLRPVATLADWDDTPEARELKAWFGGKIEWKNERLEKAGLVVSHSRTGSANHSSKAFDEAVDDVYITGSWNLHSTYVTLAGEDALAWWESHGRKTYERLLAAAAAKKTKDEGVKRMAVFGKRMALDRKTPESIEDQLPQGFSLPLPRLTVMRPICTAIITRETDTRFYIESPSGLGDNYWLSMMLKKHGNDYYIEREHLILDNASNADAQAIAAFDKARNQEHLERCARVAEEMLPIVLRLLALDKQNAVEHDESFKELLERLVDGRSD